ncbi:MAG: ATP-dependent RNA helicase HrpA [Gammaproteobacteria bacterium]|nr:ATP-dependent RNA helicase HrpA [Gammaproteobacteria bacterium]
MLPETARGVSALPITPYLEAIAAALATHAVTILCGATGSGKSTQVPQLCLNLPGSHPCRIGHTQPRRIAARAIAARIAVERGERLGETVGYHTRFEQCRSPTTRLKVMTDGILLQEIRRDPVLRAYDVVIIDEVHERSLNVDLLIGYLQTVLRRRRDLRVILMSATLEAERCREFFGDAAVIEVPGRVYPVDIRYRPLVDDEGDEVDLTDGILQAVRELDGEDRGDILVFLPGEREIADADEVLRGACLPATEVLPLYARLSTRDQQRVFAPHDRRHIILATNVAETSLTVPGVRHVIDSGLARIGHYGARSKLQRLPVLPVAQASAAQRAGRCGRERAGVCVRLYSEDDFTRRSAHTEPELRRANLAGVILRLADLRLGTLDTFPLLDPPTSLAINDGYHLLRELGAVDHRRKLTRAGQQLARLPIDPRLGRVLLAAGELNCLSEMLVIVSALSAGDMRERPPDALTAADLAHAEFSDSRSDFLWYVRAWSALWRELMPLSRRRQQAVCRARFLAWRRVREWFDIHAELRKHVATLKLSVNVEPASYRAIHHALLAGFASQIARRDKKNDYVACRQQRVRLHPSSALRHRPPQWVVAAELTETTTIYARTGAKIDPTWVARAVPHLLKRSYSEPEWDPVRGEAFVLEDQALYGLTVVRSRRLALHAHDPPLGRAVFVARALVAGELHAMPDFLLANLALIARVKATEERVRRRDLLIANDELAAFYLARIPSDVATRRQLLAWLASEPANDALLHLTEADATRVGVSVMNEYLYPARLAVRGTELPLTYRFAPAADDDGISVTVPAALIQQFDLRDFERLIPGMLTEKILMMLKRLPKEQRRYLSPQAEFGPALAAAIEGKPGRLHLELSAAAARMTGARIAPEAWAAAILPAHLRMRFSVCADDGTEIACGRDLAALQSSPLPGIARAFENLSWGLPKIATAEWPIDDLPLCVEQTVAGVQVLGYPGLHVIDGIVAISIFRDRHEAEVHHRVGVIALLGQALPSVRKSLHKAFAHQIQLQLHARRLGQGPGFEECLLNAALWRAVGTAQLPRSQLAFMQLREAAVTGLLSTYSQLLAELKPIFAAAASILSDDLPTIALRWPAVARDLEDQLRALIDDDFLSAGAAAIEHYGRYLRAIKFRLERLFEAPHKDRLKLDRLRPVLMRCAASVGTLDAAATQRVKFLIQEFRVSLFAPTLGVAEKVSSERLMAYLDSVGCA